MKTKGKVLSIVVILGVVLLACNLPAAGTGEPSGDATEPPAEMSAEDLAATYVAQTATAQENIPDEPAVTATPDTVMVSVSVATNCRTGPDASYQLLMVVQPGGSMQVVGKYTPKTYWIINMPTGGTCWLWGQYASTTGDTGKLPEIAAPAPVSQSSNSGTNDTNNSDNSDDSDDSDSDDNSNSQPALPPPPLPPVPNAPTSVDITRQCTTLTKPGDLFPSFSQTTNFTWNDGANNETGFNIFKDGTLITTLGANAQKFTETFTVLLPQSSTVTYGVQAVGPSGGSAIVTGTVSYCK